ncbi:isochorismatase family protein [Alpinimonas psychrophila]|uniref:Ureidoacrylate peracid hydrolase n=1 Tax=Alpinimonas psychrophila TaxID=748908 RepID=A0A7W3JS11_9MICO|nr:isochorismatase family cysteine hydrolase [Alpinimonas psychrophila]MBA8828140.1 ureidoacrylate peracid hydrolase [Alpinimonas psychrophila]
MWKIDPAKTALLVIDMQNDFVLEGHPMEVPEARTAIPYIQKLIATSRELGIPVIYSQHTLRDDFAVSPLESTYNERLLTVGMRKGTFGVQVIDALKPAENDIVIEKYRYDAFYATNLEPVLRSIRGLNQIDTVIITGTLTEVCCESTARGAYMRDYKVAFVSDATGALTAPAQVATENVMRTFFGRVLTAAETDSELRGSL